MYPAEHMQLSDTGQELEQAFDQLEGDTRSPDFDVFHSRLSEWLKACIQHGRFLPTGTPERRALQSQVDYWTSLMLQSGRAIPGSDRLAAFDPNAGHVLADENFPYQGLKAVANSQYFFGREDQVKEYTEHLEKHAALLIQSESGGGKSSVAMAGVLPTLLKAHHEWLFLPRLTPGSRPFEALQAALSDLLKRKQDTDAAGWVQALAENTLIIFIDQLEELLTLCTDVVEQTKFCEILTELLNSGRVKLLATLRSDHYDRFESSVPCHSLFALISRDRSIKILPIMDLAQIRAVIQKPAQSVGLRFYPASLIEKLASEAAAAPSGLPLLQYALQRLWKARPRNAQGEPLDLITAETYATLPTLRGALSTVAEAIFKGLNGRGLVAAGERLMLELTVIDEQHEVPLRRRRVEGELVDVLVNARLAEKAQAQGLIDELVKVDLIVRTGDGSSRQVEVAHEALFRYWDKFQEWLNGGSVRSMLRENRQVERDAITWSQKGRSEDFLKLRGAPLQAAVERRKAYWFEPLAAKYVDTCEAAVKRQRRNSWWIGGGLGAASVIIIGLAILSIWFGSKAKVSNLEAKIAEGQRDKAIATVASLIPSLKPLEALDLAHTLQSNSGASASVSLLAHALDGLERGTLFGQRGMGGAHFTSSGQAATQLVSDAASPSKDMVAVLPLGPEKSDWGTAINFRVFGEKGYKLASIDVGPPVVVPGEQDETRWVIQTFVRWGAPESTNGKSIRLTIDRIRKKNREISRLGEIDLPANTTKIGSVAFDTQGKRLSLVTWQEEKANETRVLRWGTDADDRVEEKPRTSQESVTALALGPSSDTGLVYGFRDGRVQCGRDKPFGTEDTSAIASLHGTPDSSRFLALHDSGGISMVDCGRVKAKQARGYTLRKSSVPAIDLVLHSSNEEIVVFSYVRAGRIQCEKVPATIVASVKRPVGHYSENCFGHGLLAARAVPVFDESRKVIGYRALPDLSEPLLITLDSGHAAMNLRESRQFKGLPSGGQQTRGAEPAASPTGDEEIWLEIVGAAPRQVRTDTEEAKQGRSYLVKRRSTNKPHDVKRVEGIPKRVAVTDSGIALVLTDGSSSTGNALTFYDRSDAKLGSSVPINWSANCMKVSPDGKKALLASAHGDALVVAIGLSGRPAEFKDVKRKPFSITTCAVGDGDNAKVVLGSGDGQVFQYQAGANEGRSVSQLLAFGLQGPALDVSIDGGSRFVAVVGEYRPGACRDGSAGNLLRIWDLKSAIPDLPVASTCLAARVNAIGPLTWKADKWVLPVYETRTKDDATTQLMTFDFTCMACDASDERKSGLTPLMKKRIEEYQPKELKVDRLKELYGI